jgi:hypothetical protein
VRPQKFTAKVKNCGKRAIRALTTTIEICGCYKMMSVDKIMEAGLEAPMIVFSLNSPINKLIDYIYSDGNTCYMFQSTILESHGANPKHIFELVSSVIKKE